MEFEMEDIEFDLKEVVEDVQMSDDELEKELKELEKEKELKDLEKENEVKPKNEENNEATSISDTVEPHVAVEGKRKRNGKRHLGKDKVSLKTFYDDLESGSKYQSHHDDNSNNNKRPFARTCEIYNERTIDYKRLNRSLHISSNCDPMIVGREVAYRLQEPKMALFGHVVRILGQHTVSEIFAETKELVNKGGIKTDSGDRMRSPGGTFLYLMKNRCYATPEQVKEIFREDNEARKQARKRSKQDNFVQGDYEAQNSEKNETHSSKKRGKLDESAFTDVKDKSKKGDTELLKHESGTACHEVEHSSKDNSVCNEVKVTGEMLDTLADKGLLTKELGNNIPVDNNNEIKSVEIKQVDGEKVENEESSSNVNTEELEEGEID